MIRTTILLTAVVGMATVRADDRKPEKYVGDAEFVKMAASGHMLESRLGKLAETNAKNEDVKRFAQQVAADHQKAYEQLKAAAEKSGIQLPTKLEPECQKCLDKFLAKNADFDKLFIEESITGHEKAIACYKQASSEAKDENVKDYAVKTLPVLQKHWDDAKKMKGTEK